MADLILLKNWIETTIEIWKPVKGFPGYDISNTGKVRSYWGTFTNGKRVWAGTLGDTTRLLKATIDKDGYHWVRLADHTGRYRTCRIHRLMGFAFLENDRPNAIVVHHRNNIPYDNRIDNLEWATISENTLHGNEIGTGNRGITHYKARLTEDDVRHIRATCHTLIDRLKAAKYYQCTRQNIDRIVQRKSWAHL